MKMTLAKTETQSEELILQSNFETLLVWRTKIPLWRKSDQILLSNAKNLKELCLFLRLTRLETRQVHFNPTTQTSFLTLTQTEEHSSRATL